MRTKEKKFLCVFFFITLSTFTQNHKPPNVLLIISDDQGFSELGSYMDFSDRNTLGAKNLEVLKKITEVAFNKAPIEVCFEAARKCMPNVDKLREQGMRFTDFHAAATCATSRGALMSSRYPQSFRIYGNDDMEGQYGQGFPAGVLFPVQLFKKAGYETGLIGKWHLGTAKGQHPNDRGLNYYFGFDRTHTEKYNSTHLYRNKEKVLAKDWLADQMSEEAIGFLKRTEDTQRLFFYFDKSLKVELPPIHRHTG